MKLKEAGDIKTDVEIYKGPRSAKYCTSLNDACFRYLDNPLMRTKGDKKGRKLDIIKEEKEKADEKSLSESF